MVEELEREQTSDHSRTPEPAFDRTEMTRLVELELDRWMEHRREIHRQRRNRSAWRTAPLEHEAANSWSLPGEEI